MQIKIREQEREEEEQKPAILSSGCSIETQREREREMAGPVMVTKGGGCSGGSAKKAKTGPTAAEEEQNQLSVLALLATALRKSMASCRVERGDEVMAAATATVVTHHMEIGWPTNVRHVTHVTFDRFHGFLGLPVEFEVEIPCRVPSASVSVFGVSAESMQCSYDSRGNSVPSILLLMQERLYSQGGLKVESLSTDTVLQAKHFLVLVLSPRFSCELQCWICRPKEFSA